MNVNVNTITAGTCEDCFGYYFSRKYLENATQTCIINDAIPRRQMWNLAI